MDSTTSQNQLRTLTEDQVSNSHQYGYLSVGKVLEGEHLAELQSEYDRVFAEARESAQMRNLNSSDGGANTEAAEEMLQIMQICERRWSMTQDDQSDSDSEHQRPTESAHHPRLVEHDSTHDHRQRNRHLSHRTGRGHARSLLKG